MVGEFDGPGVYVLKLGLLKEDIEKRVDGDTLKPVIDGVRLGDTVSNEGV